VRVEITTQGREPAWLQDPLLEEKKDAVDLLGRGRVTVDCREEER
jgi:hypothetical protein